MASWLKGRFRKPEMFSAEAGDVSLAHPFGGAAAALAGPQLAWGACCPAALACPCAGQPWCRISQPKACPSPAVSLSCPCPAPQYHIVVLPTFRDQHAELVQYLLQLPRLDRQRYFLTQHNPGGCGPGLCLWPCLWPCLCLRLVCRWHGAQPGGAAAGTLLGLLLLVCPMHGTRPAW